MEVVAILVAIAFMALMAYYFYSRLGSIGRLWRVFSNKHYPTVQTRDPDLRRFSEEEPPHR